MQDRKTKLTYYCLKEIKVTTLHIVDLQEMNLQLNENLTFLSGIQISLYHPVKCKLRHVSYNYTQK